jgi:hypothetical protein
MVKSADQDKWERSPGYVYFIAAGDPPMAVKIGITIQSGLKQRLRAHQSLNHEPLHILKLIPFDSQERPMVAAQELESELHTKYLKFQRFQSGWAGSEWFTASSELLDDISRIGVIPADLGEQDSIVISAEFLQGHQLEVLRNS